MAVPVAASGQPVAPAAAVPPTAVPGMAASREQVAAAAAVPSATDTRMAESRQQVATTSSFPAAADPSVAAPRQQVAAAAAVPVPPTAIPGMATAGTRQAVASTAAVPIPPAADAGMAASRGQPVCAGPVLPRERRPSDDAEPQGIRSARVYAPAAGYLAQLIDQSARARSCMPSRKQTKA